MAQLGFRMCATCTLHWPIDLAASGLISITATGVAGITPGKEPFGFAQELFGTQLITALRSFPDVRPYAVLWFVGQFTAERLSPASADLKVPSGVVFNYQDGGHPLFRTFGVEIKPACLTGAIDIRFTPISSVFSHAEYLKVTYPVSDLRYKGWMMQLGYTGPFYGLWP